MIASQPKQAIEDVTITTLDPGAWQDYKVLRLEALATEPQAFEASYDELRAKPDAYWTERLEDVAERRNSWLFFAKRKQRLVGMAGALIAEERHIANITSVFVAKEARGQGIGTELMTALLWELRQDQSLQRLRLYVNTSQTTAVQLYERCGFMIVDADRARYGDAREHDGYVMEKALA